eukprot:CAMPEP_0177585560 /NCGR_PEP_ID=MMETSP0419_2-20121207/4561_1 /TAXON_ID=582737 /ORGANISM="Tetraselmis sp., Strain GSL018" /LENGTH=37 /DNA_ID= /DNA_START= /DNA_END= /DNA_ORIENTATION=
MGTAAEARRPPAAAAEERASLALVPQSALGSGSAPET